MFDDVSINSSKNLTFDLYFQRLSFSHILFQSLSSDLSKYRKIYNSGIQERIKLFERENFQNIIIASERTKNELVNLIKLVKMYNQKRFKNIEDVDKYIYLLISKLKSFFDVDKKIIYSKELVLSLDKYFKLINRLYVFLDEICQGFTSKDESEIDGLILKSAGSFSLEYIKQSHLKGIKLNIFPDVDIVHKVSGINRNIIFIQNKDGFFIVLKNKIDNHIPLAYALILTNAYVSDEILKNCNIDESDSQYINMNKTLVHYLNEKNQQTNKKEKNSNSKVQNLGEKLETILNKVTEEKIDIKKDIFKNNPKVYNSYKLTMQTAKQILTKPDNINPSLIRRVDSFLDNLEFKIEKRKREKKLKDFYSSNVKLDGMNISRVPYEYRDYNMCLDAVRNNGFAIDLLVEPDEKLILEAIKQEPKVITVLEGNKKTLEVCKLAYILNKDLSNYIPSRHLEQICG